MVRWADEQHTAWVFTDGNAGSKLTEFFDDVGDLGNVDWEAVGSSDFQDMQVKEGKQAEFLVYESFPWEFIEKIGVANETAADKVREIICHADHKPLVTVKRAWYF